MPCSEYQRLHGIIERIVSAHKMTSAPSKMISPSKDNLTVWHSERAPISRRLLFSGFPAHWRPFHNYHSLHTSSPAFSARTIFGLQFISPHELLVGCRSSLQFVAKRIPRSRLGSAHKSDQSRRPSLARDERFRACRVALCGYCLSPVAWRVLSCKNRK
jgi:hypothetical protein